ncbi:flagellar basal body-associated protein FliL [Litchfieldia alkalitelluris]|uniref:flagellar basal body-associated protein FliL n=1 Tax=Litchfieldia alkalitelluris TaxID=304268 RepID=UPI0038B26E02
MNSKLITIMFIIIGAITLVAGTAFVVLTKFAGEQVEKEPTIDEIIASTVEVPEITTRLLSNDYLRISFNIETNSEKAKEELDKRQFQVKNLIIKELSDMNSEEFKGEDGISQLEHRLKDRINELMQEGKVVNVYATSFLPQ